MADLASTEFVPKKRRHADIEEPPEKAILLEVCVDNLVSAVEAERGGAGRIELCSSLSEGGLTPSCGFLKMVKQKVRIPVFAMIRPRGGDFVYLPEEVEIMKEDIKILAKYGADGFVFGCLNDSGNVDEKVCSELMAACVDKPVTFHRAFDLIPDNRFGALETIIKLGFMRILTSGQQQTALLGKATLQELIRTAGSRIVIMPGAGITPDNVNEIIQATGAKEFHGSASKTVKCKVPSSSRNVSMGASGQDDAIKVTDAQIVSSLTENAIRT